MSTRLSPALPVRPTLFLSLGGLALLAGCVVPPQDHGGEEAHSAEEGSGALVDAWIDDERLGELAGPGDVDSPSGDDDDDETPEDEPTSDDELTPLWVLQGHVGRTAVSCDDGLTWHHDQSNDDETRCWDDTSDHYLECNHDVGSGLGVQFGDGHFVSAWGWGTPGQIKRSTDGVEWDVVNEGESYNKIAYGDGAFIAGSPYPLRSDDDGLTWSSPQDRALSVWTPRGIGYADGVWVLGGGHSDDADLVYSTDGVVWNEPSVLPEGCGSSMASIVGGNGVLLVGGDGTACRSGDGGASWSLVEVGTADSQWVWTGSEFLTWGAGVVYRSPDGLDWAEEPITPGVHIGVVHRGSNGTFVAIRGGWLTYYEEQRAYRSSDGVHWTTLSTSDFPGGHPARSLSMGMVEESELPCD